MIKIECKNTDGETRYCLEKTDMNTAYPDAIAFKVSATNEEGEEIGKAYFKLNGDKSKPIEFESIETNKEYEKKGIGTALLNYGLDEVTKLNIGNRYGTKIYANVRAKPGRITQKKLEEVYEKDWGFTAEPNGALWSRDLHKKYVEREKG